MRRQCLHADRGNETKAKQGVGDGDLEELWNPYLPVALTLLPTLLQQGGQG